MAEAVTADLLLPGDEENVIVHLEPAGKDLILGGKVISMKACYPVAKLAEYVRKKANITPDTTVHIIVGDAFIAAPSERIGDLAARFSRQGTLLLKFTSQPLYG